MTARKCPACGDPTHIRQAYHPEDDYSDFGKLVVTSFLLWGAVFLAFFLWLAGVFGNV